MNNPIELTRQITDKAMGTSGQTSGPTNVEIAKEQERMAALHKGWKEHPVTINRIGLLQYEYETRLEGLYKLHSQMENDDLRSTVATLASLNKTLKTLN